MNLVVSIHDVSPVTWESTQNILEQLRLLGIDRVSLLVIPDHHGKGHFLRNESFCSWLRSSVQGGHEAVIHGYYHWRPRRASESWISKLTTRVYTADEGEFYDLEEPQAMELVSRACAEFQSAGLAPIGFVAPAWLLSPPAESALRRLGLRYTVRLRSFINLQTGQQIDSQSLVYSTRAAWRRGLSLLWNRWLNRHRHLQRNPLLRMSIHPGDFEHPAIWAQIERILRQALRAGREVRTYGQLCPEPEP